MKDTTGKANIGAGSAGLLGEGESNLSPYRSAWIEGNVSAKSREWLDADADVFLHQSLSTPCLDVLGGAEGAAIENLDGRRILDFHGNSVHQVGFGHPRVIEAVKRQLDELPFCTRRYTNLTAIELAQKLAELAPGDLGKVLFAPGGTSAIGMALKLARAATGRHKTVSMWDSFHGASLDAVSIGGESLFRQNIGPLMPGTEHVPPPDPMHCPFSCGERCNLKCAEYVDYVLEKEGDVSAVISETVRSTPYVPPRDYWRVVREACDRHGALLILDEIPTALGRTGKMFACEHYDIVPDMLVIGKGLGGGVYPLAALIVRENLNVSPDRALGHYTHEKSPVGCAAGLATLQVIEDEGLLERADKLGAHALTRLRAIAAGDARIRNLRGVGLLLGVEFVPGNRDDVAPLAETLMYNCLSEGLSFKISMGRIATLAPALTSDEEELERGFELLAKSLAATA
ncbi:MAG: aspartate aminotransferase family protein [Gammaproteobacteria bacterium]|nr:aspartate aminotransferase family protein [Gammaproteobacteria bacterium]MDX2461129.1 aspartate aminotransferase family protein [Gammaproteobacteria bacterium]